MSGLLLLANKSTSLFMESAVGWVLGAADQDSDDWYVGAQLLVDPPHSEPHYGQDTVLEVPEQCFADPCDAARAVLAAVQQLRAQAGSRPSTAKAWREQM